MVVREEKYEGIKLQKKTILYNLYINFVKNERNFKIKSFNSKKCCIFAPSFNTD